MDEFENKGRCYLCDGLYKRQGMTRHLTSCLKKSREKGEQRSGYFHLFVDGNYYYWLHLLVGKETTLSSLDHYLRSIWLECCGHLSAFYIDGIEYSDASGQSFMSIVEIHPLSVKLEEVLEKGKTFDYVYDFGSSTDLKMKVVGEGEWERPKDVILLARNLHLSIDCSQCEEPADEICTACMWEGKDDFYFCEECKKEHSCGEEMMLPVVNSPRMGVCGYCG